MSAEELPLSIPVQSIADYLSCPICMCDLTDTYMTSCGHRFCDACIKESVGRHHKCPCCNKPIQVKDLVRDHQFDTLIATINEEKAKSEKTYFDALISHASDDSSSSCAVGDGVNEHVFSPVETVLKRHLKAGLVSHQKYYQQLTTQYEKRIAQTRAEYERLKNDLHRQSLMEEELERQKTDLQSTHERQVKTLQDELDSCVTMIADAFDSYLKDHVPSLSVLPVKVSVNILSKNIQIPDVILKPHDGSDSFKVLDICSLEVLKDIIEENMERRGDKIVKYGEDAKFICFGPFTKRSLYEMNQMAFDLVNNTATNPDVFILPDQSRPVLQFSLKPGSEIALYGTVQCQSDLPKYCFASTFQKGEAQTVDYFTCKTCSINWVCRPCMEKCHKVHSIQPYILNHQPTWACCYCPKKKKCVNQPT